MTLTFSAILSAVKPRERTDQYAILAALYSLGAHASPITAHQLNDLLSLHLRGAAPGNVNASLRSYTALVEPAGADRPIRWKLTPKGVEKLRSLSGLSLTTASTDADFDADVGIVCALEHPEFTAVLNAFGGSGAWSNIGDPKYSHVYLQTSLMTARGKALKVVGTTSTSMGLTAAAIVATQLIFQFRPRLVIMVGIAAGTRDGGKEFGDILVADPSVDYNSGKVIDREGIRAFLPDPYPIGLNSRLRSVLRKYGGQRAIFESIRARWQGRVPAGVNRLHMGPLGAADQVIDDPTLITEIQKNWRKLIGVEMETYAVYRACHESPEPKPRVVSLKSVCDFAAEKTDSWQAYAAFMAAEFAVAFLKSEWESLWPSQ